MIPRPAGDDLPVMVQTTISTTPAVNTSPMPHKLAGVVEGTGGAVAVCECHLAFYGDDAGAARSGWIEHCDRLLGPTPRTVSVAAGGPEREPCCWAAGMTSVIGVACPNCGHTNLAHQTPGTPPRACALCLLEIAVEHVMRA